MIECDSGHINALKIFLYLFSLYLKAFIMKQIFCPVSNEKINEQTVRLNAFIAVAVLLGGLAFQLPVLLFILLADFFIRAFTKMKLSPISYVSHWLTNTLNLGKKPIDKAPKIFAARLGFLMILAISVFYVSGFTMTALVIAAVFMFFATLEFALAICVGCLIYTYFVLPFNK
jgi:hypothetical protein